MKSFSPVLVASITLLSGAAFAQEKQDKTLETMVGKDPKAFAAKLHHVNEHEIQLGELAQKKAQSQQVKDFGKHMVEAHQKADQQLMQLAKTEKWDLSEKPMPKSDVEKAVHAADEATEAELKQLEGPLFDSTYMAAMVNGHDRVILKTTVAAKQFKGTPLGNQLNELMPKLVEHRKHAYSVLGTVNPGAPAGGMGGAGQSGSEESTGGSIPRR
jgi:putative membrane protein